MSRESMSKALMVVALLGALGFTVKLAMDAQKAEEARKSEGGAESAASMDKARKLEIRNVIRTAINAHRQLDFESAERILVEASEKYPRVPAVWLNLGICYRSLDKLDAAERAFARVLELNNEDWDAVAEQATVRLVRGKVDEAFEMLASIPANKGQVPQRLRSDPDWTKHGTHQRMRALLEKHGVVALRDTSVQRAQEILRRKKGVSTSSTAPSTPAEK